MLTKDGNEEASSFATGMTKMSYRVIARGDNPMIAIPVGPRWRRLESVQRINGYTYKRALIRKALHAAVSLGLDSAFSRYADDPLASASGICTVELQKALAAPGEPLMRNPTIVWPWPPNRYRGRVYLHWADTYGRPMLFSKLALDEDQDRKLLHEAVMLQSIHDLGLRTVAVPRIVSVARVQSRVLLTVEAVPKKARPLPRNASFPALRRAEYAGDVIRQPAAVVRQYAWWERFAAGSSMFVSFVDELKRGLDEHGAAVCRVHGDFASKNLLLHGSVLWILDWEDATNAGPSLTDEVIYNVEAQHKRCMKSPSAVLSDLIGTGKGPALNVRRVDLGLALAYLLQAGFFAAHRLIEAWPNSISRQV